MADRGAGDPSVVGEGRNHLRKGGQEGCVRNEGVGGGGGEGGRRVSGGGGEAGRDGEGHMG